MLGQAADLILVVPATARLLAAYAARAVHRPAHEHAARDSCPGDRARRCTPRCGSTRRSRTTSPPLRRRGVHVVDPDVGRLAGGDSGAGRLARRADILAAVDRVLGRRDLGGLRVVVTAGGTREPIDAVRVIANRSQRQAGLRDRCRGGGAGAAVTLVSTVDLPRRPVSSVVHGRDGRRDAGRRRASRRDADIVVMAAAVADFRPGSRRRQAQEGSRHPRDRPRADARHPRRPRARASPRVRCSSGSPPRRTIWSRNADASCVARTSIWWSRTMSAHLASASSTTPTP